MLLKTPRHFSRHGDHVSTRSIGPVSPMGRESQELNLIAQSHQGSPWWHWLLPETVEFGRFPFSQCRLNSERAGLLQYHIKHYQKHDQKRTVVSQHRQRKRNRHPRNWDMSHSRASSGKGTHTSTVATSSGGQATAQALALVLSSTRINCFFRTLASMSTLRRKGRNGNWRLESICSESCLKPADDYAIAGEHAQLQNCCVHVGR